MAESESTHDLAEVVRARGVISAMSGDGEGRVISEALLDELLSWPDVYVRVKEEKEGGRPPRRVRFHRRGAGFGAFCIFYPKKDHASILLRLPKHFAETEPLAEARDVKSSDPYQVRIKIHRMADVPDALQLAQPAYDEVAD